MPESIHKLQPNRTLALRGFDDRGAAAALHSCTDTSFKVSGVFRDSADFCVLILHDADNFYDHPHLKHLPDFNFAGVTLEFDVAFSGLMPLDSSLFPSIDWPYLDVIREDGTTAQIRLVPSGGSAFSWHVSLDFSALGISRIRQAWLTFAPPIPPGVPYPGGEWEAIFTAWTVTGSNRSLQVAGSGSVRVEETDSWCTYAGSWTTESGFYSKGFAKVTSSGSVTVQWHCQSVHDLYLGTSLYLDRGVWAISIDGGPDVALSTYLNVAAQVNARRLIASSLSAGHHTATLRHNSGGPVYFDFLEAAVPTTEVSGPVDVFTDRAPANDYGTDHTYKLPPARILWMLDKLGQQGMLNVYVSVFWWNQRRVSGRFLPSVQVQIPAAAIVPGYNVFVRVGTSAWGRFVLGGDTATTVAAAIAAAVNVDAVGVYAESSGDILTITNRAATSIYSFSFRSWYETPAEVDIAYSGALSGGVPGTWVIDESVTPTLNRAAREWLADLCRECAARGRELTLAYSMELLNPPDSWAARFPDGTAVTTATGFATNFTTHCAFGSGILDYQKRVFAETAAIMSAAGLPVILQMGEFTWWYFAAHGGMAFYDDATKAAGFAALGRNPHTFTGPDDDPTVNGGADANFFRARLVSHCMALRDHVRASYPSALLELLLPLDVNYPQVYGRYSLGGRLLYYINAGGFLNPAGSPFDRIKIEGLDFGSGSRDFDKAARIMKFPYAEGSWAKENCRYLIPVFNGGCPWQSELLEALGEGLTVNFWAMDHFCFQGLELDAPVDTRSVQEV